MTAVYPGVNLLKTQRQQLGECGGVRPPMRAQAEAVLKGRTAELVANVYGGDEPVCGCDGVRSGAAVPGCD